MGCHIVSLAIVGIEWVKENVLKNKSFITSEASVAALQRQVKLASPRAYAR